MKNEIRLLSISEDRGVYYPVIMIDGEKFYCRSIMSKNSEADFASVIDQLESTLIDWAEDDVNNYGLAFYACGYDGDAQQRFSEQFEEKYGIYVF